MAIRFLVVIAREQRDRGKLPGGWRSTEYILYRLSGGIFRYAQYDVRSTVVGFADTLPEGESEISFTVFASVARQTPGRVNYRMLLSPIVGVADTSPEGGSKKVRHIER